MKKSGPTRIGIKYILEKQNRNKMLSKNEPLLTVPDWTRTKYFQKLSNRLGPKSKFLRIFGPTLTKIRSEIVVQTFSTRPVVSNSIRAIRGFTRPYQWLTDQDVGPIRSGPLLYDMTHIVWLMSHEWLLFKWFERFNKTTLGK